MTMLYERLKLSTGAFLTEGAATPKVPLRAAAMSKGAFSQVAILTAPDSLHYMV